MRYKIKIVSVFTALIFSFSLGFGWDAISSKIEHRLTQKQEKPLFAVTEHKPFVVVIPSYNNSEWVEKNLRSVLEQKYDNYRVIYIDDASSDATYAQAKTLIENYQKTHLVTLIHNDHNRGALENIYRAVHSCDAHEIVVICDGDDWLAHDRVLERLNETYANPDVWLTYGSYIEYPNYSYTVANFSKELPRKVIDQHSVRTFSKKHWSLSHLRTFYADVFQQIKLADFLYEGQYLDAAADLAAMIPMVEMVGDHAQFINEVLYIYNRATPLNDHKLRAKRQQALADHILNAKPYERIAR